MPKTPEESARETAVKLGELCLRGVERRELDVEDLPKEVTVAAPDGSRWLVELRYLGGRATAGVSLTKTTRS